MLLFGEWFLQREWRMVARGKCNLNCMFMISLTSMFHSCSIVTNKKSGPMKPSRNSDRYLSLKSLLWSQVGTAVSNGQVEVLWAVCPQAGCLPLTDFGGQSVSVFETLAACSTLLQTGNNHLCQVLLEPLEVLTVAKGIILGYEN